MEYLVTIGVVMAALSMMLDVKDPFVPALLITIGLYSFGILGDDDEKIAKATVASTEIQEQIVKSPEKTTEILVEEEKRRIVVWTEEDEKRVNHECWDCDQQESTWEWNKR